MHEENIIYHEEEKETSFTWKDPYSTYRAILTLNKDGVPIVASYGREDDMRTRYPNDRGFDPAVQMVMRNFIDNDMSIFKRMRGFLSGEYCETAERMQILSAIRGTF